MSDDSELRIVLAHAPKLEKAFGRKWAVGIILLSLYFARKRSDVVGLIASLLLLAELEAQVWLKSHG